MNEIWKDIYYVYKNIEYDYRSYYQVSNLGNVRSLGNGGGSNSKKRMLKPSKNKKGYLQVILCKNGKQASFKVHRLVAFMFIKNDNIEEKTEIDHIDGNKANNNITNLRWVSSKENSNNPKTKENFLNSRKNMKYYNERIVCQYDLNNNFINLWKTAKKASVETGVCYSNIIACCKGKLKTSGGFRWQYANEPHEYDPSYTREANKRNRSKKAKE